MLNAMNVCSNFEDRGFTCLFGKIRALREVELLEDFSVPVKELHDSVEREGAGHGVSVRATELPQN